MKTGESSELSLFKKSSAAAVIRSGNKYARGTSNGQYPK